MKVVENKMHVKRPTVAVSFNVDSKGVNLIGALKLTMIKHVPTQLQDVLYQDRQITYLHNEV
jgi:hypothetical protein